jgi:hypothetical protein
MVLEITNENIYIGIIVVLAAIQIVQWRKVDMLEKVMSQIIDDIKILGMAADIKFNSLEKKIDDEKIKDWAIL